MDDRGQIAQDHAQRRDVFRDDRKVDFNFNGHSQSPVLSNSRTVEATGGGVNPSPRASAGVPPLTVTPDD